MLPLTSNIDKIVVIYKPERNLPTTTEPDSFFGGVVGAVTLVIAGTGESPGRRIGRGLRCARREWESFIIVARRVTGTDDWLGLPC
jgi:hypothetical protein